MAANNSEEYPLGSPLAHIKMCESHELAIDMICEDCDEFICKKCAKTEHRDHDWNTLPTAATQRRRGLLKFLKKVKEEELPRIDEKLKMSKQITDNEELCDSEIKKLQQHYDEIMARLTEIKKRHEKKRDNLVKKNGQLNHVKSELDKKKRGIIDTVEFIEENNSTMSDYSLIENYRELTNMLCELEVHNCEHSVRFSRGEINDNLLESLVGKTLDLYDTDMTQINSFQNGDNVILVLETISEEKSYIKESQSKYTEEVDQEGATKHIFSIDPNDMCVTDSGDVYFTHGITIRCLSPSGSVSTLIRKDPLANIGICASVDGGLLVTLVDIHEKLDFYKLDSHSRRLVRHITVTGDVIHEYEYQEDGQTRLLRWPYRVTQNSNSDICVVNRTSHSTGELVIISPFGHLKSVYGGQNLTVNFWPNDVVCDSLCNILVTDPVNKKIHLLSPDGEFLKFLQTENEVNRPYSLTLYKSTLWVGYYEGLVKVFQFRMKRNYT